MTDEEIDTVIAYAELMECAWSEAAAVLGYKWAYEQYTSVYLRWVQLKYALPRN